MREITTPLDRETILSLHAGEHVLLSGVIYTARDAAHLRMMDCIRQGQELPFQLSGQVIYYAGPSPTPPGAVVGSIGPTTSMRMDAMTPALLERGLAGMIGKGKRSPEVIESMVKNGCVYFAAIGGAAALISRSIKKVETLAYEDLGTEAIYRFYVEDFPAVVAIDAKGNSVLAEG